MRKRHRHIWKIIAKNIGATPWETMVAHGGSMKEFTGREWFERTVVVTYRCGCGTEKVETERV